jgi:hypothetical protein
MLTLVVTQANIVVTEEKHTGGAIAMTPIKIKDLKAAAFKLAQSLGLHCTQTKHFKKRGLTKGLDMRRKDASVSCLVQKTIHHHLAVAKPEET